MNDNSTRCTDDDSITKTTTTTTSTTTICTPVRLISREMIHAAAVRAYVAQTQSDQPQDPVDWADRVDRPVVIGDVNNEGVNNDDDYNSNGSVGASRTRSVPGTNLSREQVHAEAVRIFIQQQQQQQQQQQPSQNQKQNQKQDQRQDQQQKAYIELGDKIGQWSNMRDDMANGTIGTSTPKPILSPEQVRAEAVRMFLERNQQVDPVVESRISVNPELKRDSPITESAPMEFKFQRSRQDIHNEAIRLFVRQQQQQQSEICESGENVKASKGIQ